jgi:hypothetical protein
MRLVFLIFQTLASDFPVGITAFFFFLHFQLGFSDLNIFNQKQQALSNCITWTQHGEAKY